jgi:hypothetical protein
MMTRHLAALAAALALAAAAPAAPLEFHLRFESRACGRPFTGRVYVMLFKADEPELKRWPSWFKTEPCFIKDVRGWKPGEPLVLDRTCVGYPVTMDRIARGTWTVQAVMDLRPDHVNFSTAPGNVYAVARRELDPAASGPVALALDRIYEPPVFKETDRVKLVEIESRLLTAFHGRPTRLRAGVVLPASYAKGEKRYPVVYEIPGFSGTHRMAHQRVNRGVTDRDGVEVLHVVLDATCHHGHHVFADSATNGPAGRALVEELIPAIERRFRAVGRPAARLVTGHSSGGWSSLWLQVNYPDFFGGCWSTAPDPVDFRDFQRINLYRPGENMFTDRDGNKRPLARRGKEPALWYRAFSDMEEVMGHGGQLGSFEAVFGERGADGRPRRLFDRRTGAIDPAVAKGWERYDIRLLLERNWESLGPRLAGKLHVYTGELDTYYLEGSTALLKESLARLKSDAVVELFPGKNHSTLTDQALRKRIAREMGAKLRAAKVVE